MPDRSILNRLEKSVDLLLENQRIRVGDIWLVPVEKNIISVNKASNFLFKENLTQSSISSEIHSLKSEFKALMSESKIFSNFIKDKETQFIIYIDNGKLGTELVGKEKNEVIEYYI